MELTSSGTYNFEVASRFFESLCTPKKYNIFYLEITLAVYNFQVSQS